MMRSGFFAAIAAITILTSVSACDRGDDPKTTAVETNKDIVDSLGDMDGMDTASDLIEQAGLERMLKGEAAYTLFLPNDLAFAKLPEDEIAWLRSEDGRPDLIAMLRLHIVPGMVAQQDLETTLKNTGGKVALANLADSPLSIRKEGETILIGNVAAGPQISLPPHIATNGVVYQISSLIQPES